ncbi:TPA: hypothetical protein ACHOZW_004984 [Raoultella ornithinolytica]|uniref:hypothetical protein n=1 Tax=Enterobacteriaceae TaxID=543 RepID=UPI000FCB063C|nr:MULTISPECIES: hypothetical protein [Enterobacteriaceae]MBN4035418.1 hypothetical protein [Citrobacter freundii]MBZ7625645.1 hypothetical protein [Klebsiella michiganensis]MCW9599800.1 hypothetical protein [Klebsiella michiganensis]MCW9644412.1 hypothetical protein [Klebsiella michiganensis]MEA8878676.1 hypothetical protein [Citrobacter freundii]
MQLGLGYLTLDRASATLSTGERHRVQLARAVRNEATGVLYVLDEPSIGLHPANIERLIGVMGDLLKGGNSVVLVDHDVPVLREADWKIEIGLGSGSAGGTVLAQGTIATVSHDPASRIGGFLAGSQPTIVRHRARESDVFGHSSIRLVTTPIHTRSIRCKHWTLHSRKAGSPLSPACPVPGKRPSCATAWSRRCKRIPLPAHVAMLNPAGIHQVGRCHAHRNQRALHHRHLQRGAGRTAPRFCRDL